MRSLAPMTVFWKLSRMVQKPCSLCLHLHKRLLPFCSELQLGVSTSDFLGELQTPCRRELCWLLSASPSAPVPGWMNAWLWEWTQRSKGKQEPWRCLSRCVTAKRFNLENLERKRDELCGPLEIGVEKPIMRSPSQWTSAWPQTCSPLALIIWFFFLPALTLSNILNQFPLLCLLFLASWTPQLECKLLECVNIVSFVMGLCSPLPPG